jgi:hypothetical protein
VQLSSGALAESSPAELLLQRALRCWQRSLRAGGTEKHIAFLLGKCVAREWGRVGVAVDYVPLYGAKHILLVMWLRLLRDSPAQLRPGRQQPSRGAAVACAAALAEESQGWRHAEAHCFLAG